MTLQIGSKIRIKETAYPGSPEPRDIAARGKTGVITDNLADSLGPGWSGCWIAELDGDEAGREYHLITDEIEVIDA